jgi:hypothetical protein
LIFKYFQFLPQIIRVQEKQKKIIINELNVWQKPWKIFALEIFVFDETLALTETNTIFDGNFS